MPKKQDWIIGGLILLCVLFVLFLISAAFLQVATKGRAPSIPGGKKVGIVEVKGTITSSSSVIKELDKYREDESVRAIVLRVNSPGGTVAACQEIYEELCKLRGSGKKIVVSMGNVAASGGYYIAVAADTIVANPGTVTGSIGVIAQIPNAEELLKKVGLYLEVVKSGKYKDIGSPVRKITSDEYRLLQGIIDDVYDQFVETVVSERNLPRKEVLKLADGRIFTGRQALKYNLVDVLGNYKDAIDLAGKMAGIGENPPVVRPKRRRTLFDFLFKSSISQHLTLSYLLPIGR
ncbi:MAG: signal peptide peptidase SppA [Candidatus Latescibacteria bacterium]|nr:signal peptide peptidase SppA [Candidatus Latescibacterota bacterium]